MSPKGGQKIQPAGRTIQEEKTAGRTIQQKGACWANHTDEKLNLNASGKYEFVERRHSRFIQRTRMETDVVFVFLICIGFLLGWVSMSITCRSRSL